MARIRTIKPELWSDEKLSECSLSARLLFIGLISFADDEGRLEHSPARIRMQVFPCGSVKTGALSEWLGELTEHSLIRIYVVDSREYIDIPGFSKHQRINRPTPSKYPPFSLNAPTPLSEDSVSPTAGSGSGMEWKGREGRGRARARAKPTPPEFDPSLIDGLDQPTWHRWLAYRQSIRKPVKPPSLEAAARALANFGTDQAAVVEQSIAATWQGLFPLKTTNGAPAPAPAPARTTDRFGETHDQWLARMERESKDPHAAA